MIQRARLIGMLNPTPSLPPPFEAIELLIPMTSPFMLTSGPPELPGIDRRVGLEEVLVLDVLELVHVPAAGADDPLADRVRQAEGAAEGQHPAADGGLVAVAEPGGGKVVAAQVQHGDVGRLVEPVTVGVERPAVLEEDADLGRAARPR